MWEIIPLNLGTLTVTRSTQICRHGVRADVGRLAQVPCIAWLLIDSQTGKTILVDAGPMEDTKWGSENHNPIQRSKEQTLPFALKQHGLKCEDITTVILTHLHWDHAYGAMLLPNAKIYIQKSELLYAVAPLKTDYGVYETQLCEESPFFMKLYKQFVLLEGDMVFDNGLQIITLPGHSPGSQGCVIDTRQGKYIIAGDLVSSAEAWEMRMPCGIYTSMEDCFYSIHKMESYNAQVLASHDYKPFEILKTK